MRSRSIVILTHALQGKAEGYFIAAVAERWAAAGHRVSVHQGLGTPPAADLAILHVDQTVVPEEYRALAARYPTVINGAATDVSKRRVSRHLVTRHDGWTGPVLVKTDANAFGTPDRNLQLAANRQHGRWLQRLRHRLRPSRSLPLGDYPLYADKQAVPTSVWRRGDLVVERFLPQRHGEDYICNSAFVMGRQAVVSAYTTREPVAKIARVREVLPLFDEIPVPVQDVRQALGLDFGKIDYVVHEGVARVLDVNPTPHLGLVWDKSERIERILGTLAAGLADY